MKGLKPSRALSPLLFGALNQHISSTIRRYKEALEAFEKAIRGINDTEGLGANIGVVTALADEEGLYAEAAVAAVLAGEKEKARMLYRSYMELIDRYSRPFWVFDLLGSPLESRQGWRAETLIWLREQIEGIEHNEMGPSK